VSRKEHERSQQTRGEALFGIQVNIAKGEKGKISEQTKDQLRKIFQNMDKDGSVWILYYISTYNSPVDRVQ
jgi:hypothetical protein